MVELSTNLDNKPEYASATQSHIEATPRLKGELLHFNFIDGEENVPAIHPAPAPAEDRVPLILWDLNGVLISRDQLKCIVRPGIEAIRRLHGRFRLGIYSSVTQRNAHQYAPQIEEAIRNALPAGVVLPHPFFSVVFDRRHCCPLPNAPDYGQGQASFETCKPLAMNNLDLSRTILIDDDPHKALPEERGNFVLVPCWSHTAAHEVISLDRIVTLLEEHINPDMPDLRHSVPMLMRALDTPLPIGWDDPSKALPPPPRPAVGRLGRFAPHGKKLEITSTIAAAALQKSPSLMKKATFARMADMQQGTNHGLAAAASAQARGVTNKALQRALREALACSGIPQEADWPELAANDRFQLLVELCK